MISVCGGNIIVYSNDVTLEVIRKSSSSLDPEIAMSLQLILDGLNSDDESMIYVGVQKLSVAKLNVQYRQNAKTRSSAI